MSVETFELELNTKGEGDLINVTEKLSNLVKNSNIKDGLGMAFVHSTTSSLIFSEDEKGLLKDLIDAAERIAPKEIKYRHDAAWGDGNGRSHIKSTVFGQSISFPIRDFYPQLGTWQSIFLIEFDVRPRSRKITLTVYGEA